MEMHCDCSMKAKLQFVLAPRSVSYVGGEINWLWQVHDAAMPSL
jgi:hypothetical protein